MGLFTSMLANRTGIRITKMTHSMYDITGNRISSAFSLSPLGDLRKSVSKLKSPAVMDMIFSIVLAVEENGDRYRRLKHFQVYYFSICCIHKKIMVVRKFYPKIFMKIVKCPDELGGILYETFYCSYKCVGTCTHFIYSCCMCRNDGMW